MNSKLLRGSLETIILAMLDKYGELYGYELLQIVLKETNGNLSLTEGALYPSLHRLEAKGILSSQMKYEQNRYRKYYYISEKGETKLISLLEDMKSYMDNMQLILNLKIR